MDGDWCLVDLSDPILEEATRYAHALGLDFHEFMCAAVEEKLVKLREDRSLSDSVSKGTWEPLLK